MLSVPYDRIYLDKASRTSRALDQPVRQTVVMFSGSGYSGEKIRRLL